jgi:hypothetical protein
MYEELFWKSFEMWELERIMNSSVPRLDGYRKRCQEELDRRHQEQNEITSL